MNCEKYRKDILLRDSGELASGERESLDRHLEQCNECAEAARTLAFVRSACGTPVRVPATPPATLAVLKEAAGRGSVRPGTPARLRSRPYPVLALAASLFVALGLAIWGFGLRTGPQTGEAVGDSAAVLWPEEVELSLDVLDCELAAIYYELDSTVGLEELAREILSMEGEKT